MTLLDTALDRTRRRDKPAGKHTKNYRVQQLKSKVTELRDENRHLHNRQAAADDFFAVLMDDRAELHNLWQYAEHKAACAEDVVVCQEADIRDLHRQIADLTERLRVASLADSAASRTQEIDTRALLKRITQGADAVTDPGQTTWGARNQQTGATS
ncbi:hypothetical protein [Streptomyces sp. NPDC002994]|uniref:hypothetical protein n=1 Tax=Streptomyces sp. NPDC002994 TaxID=3154441 RepID=UPI0033A70EFF